MCLHSLAQLPHVDSGRLGGAGYAAAIWHRLVCDTFFGTDFGLEQLCKDRSLGASPTFQSPYSTPGTPDFGAFPLAAAPYHWLYCELFFFFKYIDWHHHQILSLSFKIILIDTELVDQWQLILSWQFKMSPAAWNTSNEAWFT